ncbi:Plastid ribosomal protein L13 [Trebouxia sp. C0009 RCD-2024]
MLLHATGHTCGRLSAPASTAGSRASVSNRSPLVHQNCRQQRTRPLQTCANAPGAPTKSASGTRIKDPRIKDLGPDNWNITYYPKQHDTVAVHKPWYIIDAEGQTLGRLAVLAACVLRGKDQPSYSPSMDMGGYVIIINAEKVTVTGNKFNDKLYRSHPTAKPGTLKTETFRQLNERIPERILEKAIKGMLPKGRLGLKLATHLKVFKGTRHSHGAQQAIDITSRINQKFNTGNTTEVAAQ